MCAHLTVDGRLIGRHRNSGNGNAGEAGNNQGAPAPIRQVLCVIRTLGQALADTGEQQPQPEQHKDAATRPKLPPVKAYLPNRPGQRRKHQRGIGEQGPWAAPRQQIGDDQKAGAQCQIGNASAHGHQPQAQHDQRKTQGS